MLYPALKGLHMTTIDDINTLTPKRDFLPQHHQRIAVTLNIGLVGNPYSGLTQSARAKAYAGDIKGLLNVGFTLLPLLWRVSQDTNVLLQTYVTPAYAELPPCHKDPRVRDQLVMWSEKVTEPTDVIHFDIEPAPDTICDARNAVHVLAYRLALALSQEAIAASYRDEGARDISTREQGELIAGPKAQDWNDGVFNPAYFQRFNASVDNIAARF